MHRRTFVKTRTAASTLLAAGLPACTATQVVPEVTAADIPTWKGFNLLEKFSGEKNNPFQKDDFAMMADPTKTPITYPIYHEKERYIFCPAGCRRTTGRLRHIAGEQR
ncbi:MAG: hypothetical protein WA958_10250 [Tunicatimonas sp.]